MTKGEKLAEILHEMQTLDQVDTETSHALGDGLLVMASAVLAKGTDKADVANKIIEAWQALGKWYA